MDKLNLKQSSPTNEYDESPIQTIQPHGILIAIDHADLSIIQVSANTHKYLGFKPKELIGAPLKKLVNISQITPLIKSLSAEEKRVIPQNLTLKTKPKTNCNGFLHYTTEAIILELETDEDPNSSGFLSVNALTHQAMDRMENTHTLQELLTVTVNEIQKLIGYDRIMIYQFDHDGAGEVIAEALKENVDSYLGLHFPARDIPDEAREHFSYEKLRSIPSVKATPIKLYPELNPNTSTPLNLGLSTLKSPTPCHIEYLSNMGVSATLIASLFKDNQLWGIIACHNTKPKAVSYEKRSACKLLSQMAGARLSNKFEDKNFAQRDRLSNLRAELANDLARSDNFLKVLSTPAERIFEIVNAQGAAIILGDTITLMGNTPSREQVQTLIPWVKDKIEDHLFHTNCLSAIYPAAADFTDAGSGLLCVQISEAHNYYLLWFRKEVLQTLNWGGDPSDGVEVDSDGNLQLHPRASFDLWQESVQASSLPWKSFEINGGVELRNTIVGLVLKKADELATLNLDLIASNRELNSFAHAAAHDLKEPLRGIYNFSTILLEDYGEELDEEGQEYLNDIQGFTQRMELLISSLLRISHLRQTELIYSTVDLNKLVTESVKICRASKPHLPFKLKIPKPLPKVQCDPVLIAEVFQNLISNAIKYNERDNKWIKVGYIPSNKKHPTTIFYVSDNGIGIKPEHIDKVFALFKRLHSQNKYEGGAGAGLSLVQSIIERHGGRIWIESKPGEGSKFLFTLEAIPQEPPEMTVKEDTETSL